jgi:tetratricopeptide (TPR) repeat protein
MEGKAQVLAGDHQKSCLACFQSIDKHATVCQHCGSSQVPNKWKHFGNVLKWAGGITAIISLVITLGQVNNYLNDWKSSRRNIAIFLESANVQRDAGDFITAWNSYEKVLDIDTGNKSVLNEQLKLATTWLQKVASVRRQYSLAPNTRIADFLDKLLAVLYRGIVTAENNSELATVHAHIGLLYLYKFQSERSNKGAAALQEISLESFDTALKKDENNLYANAYKAYALYYYSDYQTQWDGGIPHMEIMEKNFGQNRRSDIIYQLLLSFWAPGSYALPKTLQLYREDKVLLKQFHEWFFDAMFYSRIGSGYSESPIEQLKVMPKKDTLELLNHLKRNIDTDSIENSMALLDAFLDEAQGDLAGARSKFLALHLLAKDGNFKGKGRAEINQAMKRLDIVEHQP